jgi:hypothetical protein
MTGRLAQKVPPRGSQAVSIPRSTLAPAVTYAVHRYRSKLKDWSGLKIVQSDNIQPFQFLVSNEVVLCPGGDQRNCDWRDGGRR